MTFEEKFIASAKALELHETLSGARVIVVGFSGGADSTVLLHLLGKCYANAEIRALHVNHMIRGEAAQRDEEHCRRLCRENGIPLEIRRIDVPSIAAARHIGIEQAAREARYSAFDEYLAKFGESQTYLCTAHNADDNLETVIFNLIRGSGARGMGGIAPRRGRILRPMLTLSSAQIRSFAESAGLDYVLDETNADVRYTRNMIRSEVIPLLRNIAPECAAAAAEASALIRRDDHFISSLASDAVAGRRAVPVTELRMLDDAVLSRAILEMYTSARGERTDFGSVHAADCIRLIRESSRGEICLPGGISMYLTDGVLRFGPTVRSWEIPSFENVICPSVGEIGGRVLDFAGDGFHLRVQDECTAVGGKCPEILEDGENIYKKSIYATIGFDKIKGTLIVRNRRAGDTIALGGMKRRLKKLLCDKKVPDRDRLPVICDGDGVLLVPGIGVRDGACAAEGVRITVWR